MMNGDEGIYQTSHGRGGWFETSIAHFGTACKMRHSGIRYPFQHCWCAATVQQPDLVACRKTSLFGYSVLAVVSRG